VKSRDVKLLFDECIPGPLLARVAEFVRTTHEKGPTLTHLLEIAPSGILDEEWVPRLKDEGWTVISADGARKPNKNRGRKLPQLCAEYGLTLIVLSPVVHNRKVFDKARTILSVWTQIVEIAADVPGIGKRYMLEPLNRENAGVGRLYERIVRPKTK
jgi:PIN like domain